MENAKKSGKQYFYLANGEVLKSIKELLESLRKADYNTFAHHVNNTKNDFSNWIRDCLGEAELAQEINKLKSKEEIISRLEMGLKSRTKKILYAAGKLKETAAKSKTTHVIKSGAKRIARMHKSALKKLTGRMSCRLARFFSSLCDDCRHDCKNVKNHS